MHDLCQINMCLESMEALVLVFLSFSYRKKLDFALPGMLSDCLKGACKASDSL